MLEGNNSKDSMINKNDFDGNLKSRGGSLKKPTTIFVTAISTVLRTNI